MTPAAVACRNRLSCTLRSLFVREHALVAVLSSLEPFVDDADLLRLLGDHAEATRTQVKRLRYIASSVHIDLPASDSLQMIDDIRHFAQHVGHRLSRERTTAGLANAIMHMATVELSLYRVARQLINDLGEPEAGELLQASEEEESHFAAAVREFTVPARQVA